MMKIFVTGTNTDIGKTYVITRLWQRLTQLGISTVIFKPFQTEEIAEGVYPDLEAYKTECGLDYQTTGLYKFHAPVSPHLAFKQEPEQQFDLSNVTAKLSDLEAHYDVILIEGAGGIAVPIHIEKGSYFMTTDLIRETADAVLSVVPAQLGAISETIVHQAYLEQHQCPPNLIVMNRYTDTIIERDNLETLQKYLNKRILTFPEQGCAEDFPGHILKIFREAILNETSNACR